MEHRLSGKERDRSRVDAGGGEAGRRRSVGTFAAVDGSSSRAGLKEGGRGNRRGRSRVDEGGEREKRCLGQSRLP